MMFGVTNQCHSFTFLPSGLSDTIQRGSPAPNFAIQKITCYSAELHFHPFPVYFSSKKINPNPKFPAE